MTLSAVLSGYEMMYMLKERIADYVVGMEQVASGLGCLGAMVFIGFRMWGNLARAEQVDFFPLLRPILLSICIMLFSSGIVPAIDAIANAINEGTEGLSLMAKEDMEKSADEYYERLYNTDFWQVHMQHKKNLDNIYDVDTPILHEHAEMEKHTRSLLTTISAKLSITEYLAAFWRDCIGFVQTAVMLFITWGSGFYLITLTFLGPLVFGLACWPGMDFVIQKWFAKYIAVSLWVPIGNICMMVNSAVYAISYDSGKEALATCSADPMDGYQTIFGLITIFCFVMIPSIAEWIVPYGGMGRVASKPMSVATSVAGAATGVVVGKAAMGAAMASAKK